MRQNRFYWGEEISGPTFILRDQDILSQLKNVLRVKIGEIIFLFDGRGGEIKAEIKNFKKDEVELYVLSREKKFETGPKACLYLAILKKENFELAVQKAVESGVSEIIPIITERTVKLGLKLERLHLIIKEAAEQSGRTIIPSLGPILNFSIAVDQAKTSGIPIIFCDLGESTSISFKLPSILDKVGIFVGPEGGWSINEQKLAELASFTFYSLGPYVLRAETAATVVTWLAINKKL